MITEIYDIDGCICENVFPNFKGKIEVCNIRKKILKTKLYPAFVKYFKEFSKDKRNKYYFLTGRKFNEYGIETFFQLSELNINPKRIIFYPDQYLHSKERYTDFKCFHIIKLALNNKKGRCIVYDDLDSYQKELFKRMEIFGLENINVKILKDPEKVWDLKFKTIEMRRGK